jgi:hypothetical protein
MVVATIRNEAVKTIQWLYGLISDKVSFDIGDLFNFVRLSFFWPQNTLERIKDVWFSIRLVLAQALAFPEPGLLLFPAGSGLQLAICYPNGVANTLPTM